MDIGSLPLFSLLLPLALIAGSWLISRVLRLSLWVTLLVGCCPFALPYVELPFSRAFLDANPLYLIGGGWALLLCLALGRSVVRPALADGGRSASGFIRGAYVVSLAASLLVVALLVSRPEVLNEHMPGWRGGAGLVLLSTSLFSMSFALARVLKAALVFAVWAFVSLVLASELFLDKLPQNVVREDLRRLESLVPRGVVGDAIDSLGIGSQFLNRRIFDGSNGADGGGVAASRALSGVASTGASLQPASADARADALRAVLIGGSPNVGFPLPPEQSLAARLRTLLQGTSLPVVVDDGTALGATVYQLRRIADQHIAPSKPDVVFIAGWSADSERGTNSYGIPGLTEREAEQRVRAEARLRQYPFVADILSSTLYAYAKKLVVSEEQGPATRDIPPRVPASEYGAELSDLVGSLRAQGMAVVLIPEPFPGAEEVAYRDEMQRVAESAGAIFAPIDTALAERNDPTVVMRGTLLSEKGYEVAAQAIVSRIALATNAPPKLQPFMDRLSPSLGQAAPSQGASVVAGIPTGSGNGSAGVPSEGFHGTFSDQARMVVRPSDISGDILFRVHLSEPGNRYYRVIFTVNGEFVADRRLEGHEGARVRFSLPKEVRELPYVELGIRTMVSPSPDSDKIGTTTTFVPVPISVAARVNGVSSIQVGRTAHFAIGADEAKKTLGTNLAFSIDPRCGEVYDSIRTAVPSEMARWIFAQPWGAVIVGTVNGPMESVEPMRAALKYIGITKIGEGTSRAILGVASIRGGEGISSSVAEGSAEITIGSDMLRSYSRFVLEGVAVNDKPLDSLVP